MFATEVTEFILLLRSFFFLVIIYINARFCVPNVIIYMEQIFQHMFIMIAAVASTSKLLHLVKFMAFLYLCFMGTC